MKKKKFKFIVRYTNGQARPLIATCDYQARKMAEGIGKANRWVIMSFGRA